MLADTAEHIEVLKYFLPPDTVVQLFFLKNFLTNKMRAYFTTRKLRPCTSGKI